MERFCQTEIIAHGTIATVMSGKALGAMCTHHTGSSSMRHCSSEYSNSFTQSRRKPAVMTGVLIHRFLRNVLSGIGSRCISIPFASPIVTLFFIVEGHVLRMSKETEEVALKTPENSEMSAVCLFHLDVPVLWGALRRNTKTADISLDILWTIPATMCSKCEQTT